MATHAAQRHPPAVETVAPRWPASLWGGLEWLNALTFHSLRARLALGFACLVVVAVTVTALYAGNTLRQVLFDRVGTDLLGDARLYADALSDPLSRGDAAAVQAYLEHVDPLSTARILVVDANGNVVGVTSMPGPPDIAMGHAQLVAALTGRRPFTPVYGAGFSTEWLVAEVPVLSPNGDQVIGALRASYDLEDVQYVLAKVNFNVVLGAAVTAVIAALLGLVLATSVAHPTQRVAAAALDLAEHRSLTPLPEPRGAPDEIRQLVRAFNSLSQQLSAHERARNEFASDVAHELHSLASAMQTAAQALERGAAEQNPELGERLVAGLVGHTARLDRLADDLLELARWQGGTLRMETVDLDLADLIQATVDEWTAEAERRGMAVELQLPPGPLPVRGDPARLTQALGNVLENALKYAGAGGWIRVSVRVDRPRNQFEIEVRDSGPGIAPEALPHIFDRYFRVEGRTSGGPGGMGLGLAIARGIAQVHGGDLRAESQLGSGARFYISLPRLRTGSRSRAEPGRA